MNITVTYLGFLSMSTPKHISDIDLDSLKPCHFIEKVSEKDAIALQTDFARNNKSSEPDVWVYKGVWVTYLYFDFEADINNLCEVIMVGFKFQERKNNEEVPLSILSALRTD